MIKSNQTSFRVCKKFEIQRDLIIYIVTSWISSLASCIGRNWCKFLHDFELLASGRRYMIGCLGFDWQGLLNDLLHRSALVHVDPMVWEVGRLRGILRKRRVW